MWEQGLEWCVISKHHQVTQNYKAMSSFLVMLVTAVTQQQSWTWEITNEEEKPVFPTIGIMN